MDFQDKDEFLRHALKDSLGNLQIKARLDDIEHLPIVHGPDLNDRLTFDSLMANYRGIGIQASVIHKAIQIINAMYDWRLEVQDMIKWQYDADDLNEYSKKRCMVFLGCSSNLMTSGVRELMCYLLKYRMADVFVTPAGGIEEDLIRCFGDYKIGGYHASVPADHEKQGNLYVPLAAQDKFKAWFNNQIRVMHQRQDIEAGIVFTPSSIIRELGIAIDNEKSCLYWASKNHIPVFSPAFTDGYMGECLFEYNIEHPGFIIDVAKDIHLIDKMPHRAKCTGALIFGGGIIKHHILNANLMKNGADFGVFVNTGSEWEASDSGAKPNEALSWGKLKLDSEFAKVYGDANVVAPLLIAGSVLKDKQKYRRDIEWHEYSNMKKNASK